MSAPVAPILLGLILTAPGLGVASSASTCAQATQLILIRHARTAWNASGLLQGNADVPLDETGRAQARALADALAGRALESVYSSPLRRALETARAIAGAHGLAVVIRRDLREVGVGRYTGYPPSEIPSETRQAWNRDPDFAMPSGIPDPAGLRDPGDVEGRWFEGESLRTVAERAWRELGSIAAEHCGRSVAVVTHGGVLQTILTRATGRPVTEFRKFQVSPAGWVALEFRPDGSVAVLRGP